MMIPQEPQETESKKKELDEISLVVFDRAIAKKSSLKKIAKDYNVSVPTIYNWIKRGRKLYLEEHIKDGNDRFADVLKKYEKLERQIEAHYKATNDLNALKLLQSLLGDYRKMFSFDAAPKAAVNEDGKAVDNKLILVINTNQYEAKEKLSGYVVEGEVKEV